MKTQQLFAAGRFAFGKYRNGVAIGKSLVNSAVDTRCVTRVATLNEQGAGTRRQPADKRPVPDLGLGDESQVPNRMQNLNVEPGNVV